ncbi:hypothetical protein I6F26_29060 [Ensifer sp. IC3342]|nr:hypothetical protein [Ensifer sp. IC4062]MCA1408240.1 hypothetical protein [Ensifer sp. BRP08]MCA1444897.1 hypothetical protein [Ensifer sp. IC4062]MCA1450592.1 hypothetical protein [Ensifer sp. IC3342]
MRVYGFQIVPGSNETLAYSESKEGAFAAAQEHRRGLLADGEITRLDAMAVYEVTLADLTVENLLAILNEPEALTEVFVLHKTLVGFVTES